MLLLPLVLFAAEPTRAVLESPVVWRQVGPNPSPQMPSALPIPRRKRVTEVPPPVPGAAQAAAQAATQAATQSAAPIAAPARAPTRYTLCLAAGEKDLAAGIAAARAWLAESQSGGAPSVSRGASAQCLGQLLAAQGDYSGAEAAFAESARQAPSSDVAAATALQAMAGNAALAGGRAETALTWFDKALLPVPAKAPMARNNAAPNEAMGAVQIDRARALVALDRLPEAGGALEEAHRLAPNDPEGWLFSATLARRSKDLERAQRDIEVAASLAAHGDQLGLQIGLEAGVIAILGGREDAARKSWESVLAVGAESAEAKTARGYLDQLGSAPAPAAQPAKAAPPETPR